MVQNTLDAEIAACAGAQAFAHLLTLAETRDSGQIPRIARFLADTYSGHAFQLDLFEMRAVDARSPNPQRDR